MAKEEEGTPFQSVNSTESNDDQKTSTTDQGVEKLPAPDGGWGWMVVLGVCICHLTFGLIIKAFGVTYLILLDKFHSSATATIWIGAITVTCLSTTGSVLFPSWYMDKAGETKGRAWSIPCLHSSC